MWTCAGFAHSLQPLRSGTGAQMLTSPEATAGRLSPTVGLEQRLGELNNSPGVGAVGDAGD